MRSTPSILEFCQVPGHAGTVAEVCTRYWYLRLSASTGLSDRPKLIGRILSELAFRMNSDLLLIGLERKYTRPRVAGEFYRLGRTGRVYILDFRLR